MSPDFQCVASGKWILAGEHSVLRGQPALVFPLVKHQMKLSYFKGDEDLEIELSGSHGSELQLLAWGVIDKAIHQLKQHKSHLKGRIIIESEIPVGAGMGASAALCVILTKWFHFLNFLNENDLYEFARQLENLFHGESSGVDIAVSLFNRSLIFERSGRKEIFKPHWTPKITISYSGQKGVTKDCVEKVKKLISENSELGLKLDQLMGESVIQSLNALSMSQEEGLPVLIDAIKSANQIFKQWGLTEGAVDRHMKELETIGALAVKPTGSGGGGFVLALWNEVPNNENLLRCF